MTYRGPRFPHRAYGRAGTDEGRSEKLIPNAVLAEILAYRADPSVSARDRFYLSALAIAVSTGLRISELMTLPADCLINDERALLIRHFPAKNGREAARPIVAELRDVVEDAVAFVRQTTETGRKLARTYDVAQPIDWHKVLTSGDVAVIDHFVRRWAKEFIENPNNRLLDSRMAWNSRTATWVPIEDAFDRHQGNISAMSRELGVSRRTVSEFLAQTAASRHGEFYRGGKERTSLKSFDTDARIVSVQAFSVEIGVQLKRPTQVAAILEEAAWAQIKGKAFVAPDSANDLAENFCVDTCVLRDPDTGRIVLAAKDALFVLLRNQLSLAHETSAGQVTILGASHLNNWLAGYTRDHGTGKETDSVFSRLGIKNSRTGEIAKFTVHDIRHWLNTAYEDGGLTQDQIAILFNRKSISANSGYQHTTAVMRAERLKQSVRDGIAIGHVATAHASIAQESPEEAEAFLAAASKFYNPMPHGICLLNWAAEVCPHALSCFSCGDPDDVDRGPCEHLIIDKNDKNQIDEIARINRNAAAMTAIMVDDGVTDSPQFAHFELVRKSTAALLGDAAK